MNNVKFDSIQHAQNYHTLQNKYPQSDKASDYRAACYILALPDVYQHIGEVNELEWPFSWCFDYETVEVQEDEDWDYSKDGRYYSRDCKEDEKGNLITGERFAGLSGGTRRLVQAAMNLFNGTKGFELEDGVCSFDDRLFKVFLFACMVRKGARPQ